MTEEEIIKTIEKEIKEFRNEDWKPCYMEMPIEDYQKIIDAMQGLLDLYNKQKEEIEELKDDKIKMARAIKYLTNNFKITEDEVIEFFCKKEKEEVTQERLDKLSEAYISKDEVLKALGYEENGEEYKRIYNKEELILSLIRTINEECDRLEDIEDQKTMLEIHNIENQRDKYWQDKIRDKIKEYREQRIKLADGHFFDNPDNTTNDFAFYVGQEVLKQLLEEN